MKAQIKIDFEKWFIKQLSQDSIGYYISHIIEQTEYKVYVWFEGQNDIPISDNYISIRVVPLSTTRQGTNTYYHHGFFRFYVYAKVPIYADIFCDVIGDMVNEKRIEETGGLMIDLDVLHVRQRGNHFKDWLHFENICNISFSCWTNPNELQKK